MTIKEENMRQIKVMRENIRILREDRNWSIKKLSELSRISENILIDIEDGQDFDIWYLYKLCGLYDIKLHEIFSPICIHLCKNYDKIMSDI